MSIGFLLVTMVVVITPRTGVLYTRHDVDATCVAGTFVALGAKLAISTR